MFTEMDGLPFEHLVKGPLWEQFLLWEGIRTTTDQPLRLPYGLSALPYWGLV